MDRLARAARQAARNGAAAAGQLCAQRDRVPRGEQPADLRRGADLSHLALPAVLHGRVPALPGAALRLGEAQARLPLALSRANE